jgi:ribosomal protein L35
MNKQKRNKTVFKRVKITANGKLMRRHQFASGHLKTAKSKGALEAHKKMMEVFKGNVKTYKKMLGI